MRDQRLGRDAALDQPLGCRRLHHFAGAGLAGIFGTARHDHLQLRRDHVEPFRDVLTDPVLKAAAARAGLVGHVDNGLFARQMRRQCAPIDLPFARRDRLCGRLLIRLRGSFGRRECLLQILERKRQLIGVEPLRAAAEAMSLQLLDDRHQPGDLMPRVRSFTACRSELLGMPRALAQQQSP